MLVIMSYQPYAELPEDRALGLMSFRLCQGVVAIEAGRSTRGVRCTQFLGSRCVSTEQVRVRVPVVQFHSFGGSDPLSTLHAMLVIYLAII